MRSSVRAMTHLGAICACLAGAQAAAAAPGDLDAGFGSGGVFAAPGQTSTNNTRPYSALDAEGRLLIAFSRDTDADGYGDTLTIARLTTAGALDPTFQPPGGTPGIGDADLGPLVPAAEDVRVKGVRPGPGGSVIALAATVDRTNGSQRVVLVRLTSTGALDGGFGDAGRVVESSGPGFAVVGSALAVDSQGRALVAGIVVDSTTKVTVTRHKADGSLDGGWGTAGRAEIPAVIDGGPTQVHDVEVVPGDGAVFAGEAGSDALVGRLTPAGVLDSTFAEDGVAVTDLAHHPAGTPFDPPAFARAEAVTADARGRVVIAGVSSLGGYAYAGAAARFTASGDVDTGFANGQPKPGVTFIPGGTSTANDVRIGCGDRVLLTGGTQLGGIDVVLARLTADGVTDPAFAPGAPTPGVLVNDLGGADIGYALDLDAQGRAHVTGIRLNSSLGELRTLATRHLDAAGCAPGEQPPGPPVPSPSPGPGSSAIAAGFSVGGGGSRRIVTLDASGSASSDVSRLLWDLSGDGRTDVSCGPEAPVLQTEISGSRTVGLTVVGAGGQRASSTQTVTGARLATPAIKVPAGLSTGAARSLTSAASKFATTFTAAKPFAACLPRSPSDPQIKGTDVTALGGPAPGCVTELQIPDTKVAAVGCLREVPLERLPPAERTLINTEILGYFAGLGVPTVPETGAPPCRVCGTGARARAAANAVDAALLLQYAKQVAAGSARFWVADPRTTIRINGLDYTPASGHSLVLVGRGMIGSSPRRSFPAIVSSGAEIGAPTDALGGLRLRRAGTLVVPIDVDKAQIASLRLTDAVPFAAETTLRGDLNVLLRDQASDLVVAMALPPVFSKPGGGPVTATVTLRATNRDGIRLGGVEVTNIYASLLGVGVEIPKLKLQLSPVRAFEGDVRVSLFPPLGRFEGQISVRGRSIEFLRIAYQPGPPGIKVGPGIFLYEVSGGFEDRDVTRIFGEAKLAAGSGLGSGCAPLGVVGGFDFRIDPPPLTLTLRGAMELACIKIPLEQSLTVAADGYASFTAGLDKFELGPVELTAKWGATFFDGRFTAEGSARAAVDTGPLGEFGIGGTALLSDRGLAMCASVDVLLDTIEVGFGLDWSPPPVNALVLINNLTIMAPSCDVGPWRTVVARSAQAGTSVSFEVARGQRAAVVGVVGSGEAPLITLRDPAGRITTMPSNGIIEQRGILALRVPATKTTHVMLARPAPGRWTIETQDGARIAELRRAPILPEPDVRASVRSAGGGRQLLELRAGAVPGQVVRVFEQAPGGTRELGELRGTRFRGVPGLGDSVRQVGTRDGAALVRLTPSDARGTARALVALVEQNGLPRERRVIARFRARPPQISRAARIRVRRSRTGKLTVSWRRPRNAERDLVGLELGDGRALSLVGRGGRVTVSGVRGGQAVRVSVVGTRINDTRRGAVARARFRLR